MAGARAGVGGAGPDELCRPEFHKRETTMLGSRNATTEDFETVIAAMKAGQVPVAALANAPAESGRGAHALCRAAGPGAWVS